MNFPPNLLCNNLPQDPSGRISLSLHAEVEFLPLRSQTGDVESPGSRFAGVGLDPVVEIELPVDQVGRILDGEVLTFARAPAALGLFQTEGEVLMDIRRDTRFRIRESFSV